MDYVLIIRALIELLLIGGIFKIRNIARSPFIQISTIVIMIVLAVLAFYDLIRAFV